MTKLSVYILLVFFLGSGMGAAAQYRLKLLPVDRDSFFVNNRLRLQTSFQQAEACRDYINKLPALLQSKGFATASVDSVHYDVSLATVVLFLGREYQVGYIRTDSIEERLLQQAGWDARAISNKPLDPSQLEAMRTRVLDYLENNGHPFAKVQLDSLRFEEDRLYAALKITKGPLYKIDSVRNLGGASLSNSFLQHYLDLPNGSIYKKAKLQEITRKIRELPYVEEAQSWDLTMHGAGSVLNLYLKPKKSSQFNVLIGLLPSNSQLENNKMLVTGEANIKLRNALGNGEMIGVNWQQLQVKAPRLDLAFEQPYMFGTPFGITSSFNLFKKDSSFLNLSLLLGLQYSLSASETGKLFIQQLRTNLLTLDTVLIKSSRTLPAERDVSSVNLGLDYTISKTDYRFSPRKGSELQLVASVGTRKVRKNNVIVKLSSPDFNYDDLYDSVKLSTYQFRIKAVGAHYFPLGRQSTLKTAINGGWFQSPTIYRNELFQIGGHQLLRGFDEESIYVSRYAVGTIEYRYLIGLNSFLFSFMDLGLTSNSSASVPQKNQYIGGGLGLAFETKAGVFNISYAAGKRDDLKFDLRQAKIHLGYVNYF